MCSFYANKYDDDDNNVRLYRICDVYEHEY